MIVGLIDRLLAVTGAILFTQIPLYYQQYVYRLSGHLAELELQVTLLRQTAARSGKSLDVYINKFLQSQDSDFLGQGEFMLGLTHRLENLQNTYQALVEAPSWTHSFYLIKYADPVIAKATFNHFEPGLSFTLEGVLYGLIGVAVGLLVFRILKKLFYKVISLFMSKHDQIAINNN